MATSPTTQASGAFPQGKTQLLTLLPHLLSTLLTIWSPVLKQKVLDLINPIAFNHVPAFIHSIGKQGDQIDSCVDLAHSMKVIPLESLATALLTCVKGADSEVGTFCVHLCISIQLCYGLGIYVDFDTFVEFVGPSAYFTHIFLPLYGQV